MNLEARLNLLARGARTKTGVEASDQGLQRKPRARRDNRQRQALAYPHHPLADKQAGTGLHAAREEAGQDNDVRLSNANHACFQCL